MSVLFYGTKGTYGCFSNFSRDVVCLYGYSWPTAEHAFQAMKFHPHRVDLVQRVLKAETPAAAAHLGRDRSLPIRPDWEASPDKGVQALLNQKPQPEDHIHRFGDKPEPLFARIKDVVMYEIVRAKVLQNSHVQETLLETGTEILIEDSIVDPYWGWGASRVGENKLGRILMYTREAINQG